MDDRFILGVDCERLFEASFTGQNAMIGSLTTRRLRNAWNGADVTTAPEQIRATLHYGGVLNIADTGAQVLKRPG
eukprot:10688669-Alexandrium_andersonii.AAC.1